MIRVNDKWDVPWQPGTTINDVLAALQFTHQHLVVSVNEVLVPQGEFSTHPMDDSDRVRIIHVIGGG